jgi:hypothetical protein
MFGSTAQLVDDHSLFLSSHSVIIIMVLTAGKTSIRA